MNVRSQVLNPFLYVFNLAYISKINEDQLIRLHTSLFVGNKRITQTVSFVYDKTSLENFCSLLIKVTYFTDCTSTYRLRNQFSQQPVILNHKLLFFQFVYLTLFELYFLTILATVKGFTLYRHYWHYWHFPLKVTIVLRVSFRLR